MMRSRLSMLTVALLALPCSVVAAQKDDAREVRTLEVDDPNLKPVLFAAVEHIFDEKKGQPVGFDGVYINKRLEPSLTSEVRSRLNALGLARIDPAAGCEQLPGRSGPTPPAGTDKSGKPIVVATGTNRAQSSAICSRGYEYSYSFWMVRVAGDSAYVETRIEGTARSSTQCLVLFVPKEGGWRAAEMKRTKIGQCGK